MYEMNEIKSPAQEVPEIPEFGDNKLPNNKRKYISVNYNTRKNLLKIINEESLTIKTAAERLGINYSNAKNIVKVYKKEHRIAKLPKKPNLTLKEVTSAFYFRDSIPLKAALLPFYDANEAQQFLNWTKEKKKKQDMENQQQVVSNHSTRSGIDLPLKLPIEEKNKHIFDFEVYRSEIIYRFFFEIKLATWQGYIFQRS